MALWTNRAASTWQRGTAGDTISFRLGECRTHARMWLDGIQRPSGDIMLPSTRRASSALGNLQ